MAAWALLAAPAQAATCQAAGARGAAPEAWQTYCWLDLTSYNDATARSVGGQAFTIDLSDGSKIAFTLRTASTAATGATAQPAPSWTGAAIGNSSFLNIPGRPILYMSNTGSTVTFTISNIRVIPPPGVATITNYAFVVADAESTDNAETIALTTDGQPWAILDAVPPRTGNQYPTLAGAGTRSLTMSGGGQTGSVGSYIAASNAPKQVTAAMTGQGLQGLMFAVRFASIRLTKVIGATRIAAADQFAFEIASTSSGEVLAAGTTAGTGNGPFEAAVLSTASGVPLTLRERMAAGSASALSDYRGSLTCANATPGSRTPVPTDRVTSSYDFGALDFGDQISCTFTNTAYARVSVAKRLAAAGRVFAGDQFTVRLMRGATAVAQATSGGTGATVTGGAVPATVVTPGQAHSVDEVAAGTTELDRYAATLACTNGWAASPTVLPTAPGQAFTPALGDQISCTLTNTRSPATAILLIEKTSRVLADGVSGSDPKAIPGATVEYSITVTNRGDGPADADTVRVADALPAAVVFDGSVPVALVNGATPSGLAAFNPATMVAFSNAANGAAPYGYSPSGPADPAVRGLRVSPAGTLAAATGAGRPSFTVVFRVKVK